MMKMWEIDDGETHWVIANSDAQALGLYVQNTMGAGMDWPEEKPSIKEKDPDTLFTFRFDGYGEKKLALTVREWCEIIQSPQYFASTLL